MKNFASVVHGDLVIGVFNTVDGRRGFPSGGTGTNYAAAVLERESCCRLLCKVMDCSYEQSASLTGSESSTLDLFRSWYDRLSGILDCTSCRRNAFAGFTFVDLNRGLTIVFISAEPSIGGHYSTLLEAESHLEKNAFFDPQLVGQRVEGSV